MTNMQMNRIYIWIAFFLMSLSAFGVEPKRGVLILASTEGEVRFEDGEGNPGNPVKPGEPIPPSYFVITGAGAKQLAY